MFKCDSITDGYGDKEQNFLIKWTGITAGYGDKKTHTLFFIHIFMASIL